MGQVQVDTMTIKDLGRWESLEMVQRYTRSVTFEESMKHYKVPLSEGIWPRPEGAVYITLRDGGEYYPISTVCVLHQ